jgi:uncharacterized cupredoxin-like copper-binding protein
MARPVALVAVLVAFAACSNATDTQGQAARRTVVIQMRDNHFEPDRIDVRRGTTVAFRFMNQGRTRHDAFVGDAEAQAAHEREARMNDNAEHGGGHEAADRDATTVEPGRTGVLNYRFSKRGEILIGCHEPGHYEGGMVVKVTVN